MLMRDNNEGRVTPPLATIGIPSYNRRRSLERSLQTALGQDYDNFEVLVCDNASTDGTQEFVENHLKKDSRLRYIRHPENKGPLFNFKSALESARGVYFLWLGSDDRIDPNYLKHCIAHLQRNPDHVLVSGRIHYYKGGKFLFEEPQVNIHQAGIHGRVAEFYRSIGCNGVTYGVGQKSDFLRIPFTQSMGWDWLFVAGLAGLGKIQSVDGTIIHREFTWDDSSFEQISSTFKLSSFQKNNPYLAIAILAWDQIRNAHPLFGTLSKMQRWLLAVHAMAIIRRRHKIGRLRLLRSFMNGEARGLLEETQNNSASLRREYGPKAFHSV